MLDPVSLRVADYDGTKKFYAATLAPLGAPGLRPEYPPNYYGAFILDPDGYNIEAVCHKAE